MPDQQPPQPAPSVKEVRARLQGLAKTIEEGLGGKSKAGFILLVFAEDEKGNRCEYVSNVKREDAWRAMAEWVMNTSNQPVGDS